MVRAGTVHRSHPEAGRHLLLCRQAAFAQRGGACRRRAQHRHEHAPLAAAQPLDVTAELVDPHRHLEARTWRHRVLAVRPPARARPWCAPPDRPASSRLPRAGARRSRGPGATWRSSPVCVTFWVVAPQCTSAPASPSQARSSAHTSGTSGCPVLPGPPHGPKVQIFQVSLADDLARRRLGDDPELGLRPASAPDVEPRLKRRLGEQRALARVVDPREVGSSSMRGQPRHVEVVHAPACRRRSSPVRPGALRPGSPR